MLKKKKEYQSFIMPWTYTINRTEFSLRAQLVQFTQYRSLFESYKRRMFHWYSGILFWKSQSPWPALRGGLYDYYLGLTGGFFGVRAALLGSGSALEGKQRVHTQLNLADHTLTVVAPPDETGKAALLFLTNCFFFFFSHSVAIRFCLCNSKGFCTSRL